MSHDHHNQISGHIIATAAQRTKLKSYKNWTKENLPRDKLVISLGMMSALTCSSQRSQWGDRSGFASVVRTQDPFPQLTEQLKTDLNWGSYEKNVHCTMILLFPSAEAPLPQWPGDCLPQVSSLLHCAALGQRREKVEFFTEPAPGSAAHSPHSRFLPNFPLRDFRDNCLMRHLSSRVTCVVSLCLYDGPMGLVTCACVLSSWQSLTDSSLCQCALLAPDAPPPAAGPRQLALIRAELCITVLHLSLNRLARVRLLPVTSMPAQRNWWYMYWAGPGSAVLA